MVGKQYINLYSKRYSFEIELERKITIIRGDSGTGKSTLINAAYKAITDGSFRNKSSAEIMVILPGMKFKTMLREILDTTNAIILMDENVPGLMSHEMGDAINESSCYFVIVTRDNLASIPYSINSVYGMETDNKGIHRLRPIYEPTKYVEKFQPNYIICEDSKSGFILFKMIDTHDDKVSSAGSKDNIVNKSLELYNKVHSKILIIADGSAIGPQIDSLRYLQSNYTFTIAAWLPESFEFVLLHSIIFEHDEHIQAVISNPIDYVDSKYMSYEKYFEALLNNLLHNIGESYKKSGLNRCFVDKCCGKGRICRYVVRDRGIDKLLELIGKTPIDISSIFDGELNKNVKPSGNMYVYKPEQ